MPAVVHVSVVQRPGAGIGEEASAGVRRSKHQSADRGLPPAALDELLHRFFGMPEMSIKSSGSGFIIDPEGHIVTEDHIVGNAEKVTVTLQEGKRHGARIIGRDPKTDLALLKIDVDNPLPYVGWGDSDTARVGDWVVAIGNPFGLDASVSSGIISGRGRDMHLGPYDDFLQIDAAINLGNSGGPTDTKRAVRGASQPDAGGLRARSLGGLALRGTRRRAAGSKSCSRPTRRKRSLPGLSARGSATSRTMTRA
jgi:serine protease Do